MGEQPVFPLSGIKISEIRSINSALALYQAANRILCDGRKLALKDRTHLGLKKWWLTEALGEELGQSFLWIFTKFGSRAFKWIYFP